MKDIMCGTLWVPYMNKELKLCSTYQAQTIVCVENREFVAGVLFDGYNGASVAAHILIKGRPLKEWFVYIFDYPFNILRVKKIIGQVASDNFKALELDKAMGFEEEAELLDVMEGGVSLKLLTMTREQCRVLNNDRWTGIVSKISRT